MAGSKQTAPEGSGMQKTLSIWNYFTIGFGAIIGTGWVLLVGDWMIIGGGPVAAMIAFFISAADWRGIRGADGSDTDIGRNRRVCRQNLRQKCFLHNGLVSGTWKRYPVSVGGNCNLDACF